MDSNHNKHLRERAKEILFKSNKKSLESIKDQDIENLIEELGIYKIELELQNKELRNRQEELEKYKNFYQELFDNAPTGYAILDSNFKFSSVNITLSEMLNVPQEKLEEQLITRYIHPDYQDEFYLACKKLFGGSKKINCEIKILPNDKTELFCRIYAELIHHQEKKQARIALVDISESKAMELQLLESNKEVSALNEEYQSQNEELLQITEELQATNENLKESEQKFRALFEKSRDGIVLISEDGRFLDCNKAYEKMLGYTIDELSQKTFLEVTPQKWHKWESSEIVEKKLLKEGFADTYEKEYIRKDGSVFPVELAAYSFKDTENKKTYLWGIVRDISERKRVNDLIKASETKLRAILDSSLQTFILLDPNRMVLACNKTAKGVTKALFGKSIQEAHSMDDYVLEQDLEEYKSDFEHALQGKNILKEKSYTIQGKEYHSLNYYTPVMEKEDNIIGVSMNSLDITAMKESEKALRELEGRYATIGQNFPNGAVFLFDRNDVYTFMAGQAIEDVNLDAEKAIGKSVSEVFPESVHSVVVPQTAKIFEGEKVYYEVEYMNRYFANWGVPVCDENNNIREGLVYAIDISELKNKEKEIEEARKEAVKSDQLKSAFLANMSHELRTPLNAIIGFSDIIDLDTPIEDVVSMNKMINDNGTLLLKIIESILDISLLETENAKPDVRTEDVTKVFEEIQMAFQLEFNKKQDEGVRIVTNFPDNISDVCIRTDIFKLRQLITQLLNNALKFTLNGKIEYGFVIDGNEITFYVSDTGIGIEKEHQECIFERFRQIDDSNTRQFGGIGLGLAICRKISDLLKGKLWLESEPGKGSCFCFSLKDVLIFDETTGNKQRKAMEVPKLHNYNILIAEDEYSNYQYLKLLLSKTGANIFWAKNGQEAIDQYKESPGLHLILMDIRMPKLNGLLTTKKIREMGAEFPIIAQTAYATSEDIEKIFSHGCTDFLSKPIRKAEFYNKIIQHLK